MEWLEEMFVWESRVNMTDREQSTHGDGIRHVQTVLCKAGRDGR
jgi:hypothetical protein